jgi:hypothetical protein
MSASADKAIVPFPKLTPIAPGAATPTTYASLRIAQTELNSNARCPLLLPAVTAYKDISLSCRHRISLHHSFSRECRICTSGKTTRGSCSSSGSQSAADRRDQPRSTQQVIEEVPPNLPRHRKSTQSPAHRSRQSTLPRSALRLLRIWFCYGLVSSASHAPAVGKARQHHEERSRQKRCTHG